MKAIVPLIMLIILISALVWLLILIGVPPEVAVSIVGSIVLIARGLCDPATEKGVA
ncbi:hypothetical protein M1P56_35705 (plasmid) [Streptomyces sp. HU2014]|uniref:hypothetical protein n=1 Tax=Streptomyces sp. HU2014 TaxID=2939414 RepID=UPI00200FF726|nr:hypothetical protein [Streptomyces sp. HU2014]UQI49838.1 hypothetical protein M1P56_35705 [Streptomyces sp. HU2014]